MPSAFADITFTPSVKAAQRLYGSREANRGFELAQDARNELTEREAEFIAERDSFYQATVSESGWPYVQHRGGAAGFLKVLDARTLAFADFRGNVQYLSVGNLAANDRIALILMDYANRRRLKIWGRARIVHKNEHPELIARLEVASYRAHVERGIVIHVEAYDWNCPQHITPRLSEAEVERLLAPLLTENKALKSRSSMVPEKKPEVLGDGPLELVISGIRQLTPRIRAFELRRTDGTDLPKVEAGAHLRVPVTLQDGQAAVRHYSISSNPARRDAYEIAILREEDGRGGSRFAHAQFELGLRLRCGEPHNDFSLHTDARPTVLIAGGIGITPIKAMAQALKLQGRDFHLHYAARSAREMAYRDRLVREFGQHLTTYLADQAERIDIEQVLSEAPADAVFYVCGPGRLIDGVVGTAKALDIDAGRLRFERFTGPTGLQNQAIEVELRRSKKVIRVCADQTVLDAVRAAGVDALSDCGVGNCGTCAVKVLEGVPEHRDAALTAIQRERAGLMCICVSRAQSERLVLDL